MTSAVRPRNLALVGLVVAGLALAGAAATGGFGDDTTPGTADAAPAAVDADDANDADERDGVVVETYQRSFDRELATGELDLRVDRGHVQVHAWDEAAYEVQVLRDEVPEDRVSDHGTEVEFDDATEDDHLALSLVAQRSGTYSAEAGQDGVRSGEDVDLLVVAHVPADVTYEEALACSGEAPPLSTVLDPVEDVLETGEDEDHDRCVETAEVSPRGQIVASSAEDDRGRVDNRSGLWGLEGETAMVTVRDSDVHLADASFGTAHLLTRNGDAAAEQSRADDLVLATRNGDATATDVTAESASLHSRNGDLDARADANEVSAASRNGDVDVHGAFADAEVSSRNGDVELTATELNSGSLTADTRNGHVDVHLPDQPDTGYEATGESRSGDVEIRLEDAEQVGTASDEEREDREHARTNGYEEKATQVDVDATSRNGDVTVLEEGAGPSEDVDEAPASALALD